jgi:hypothetical protein
MKHKFVAVAFNPQKIDGGVLSLRAADRDSTDICGFMTKICILLFYSVSRRAVTSRRRTASKLRTLLITANASNTNRIQREFLFNDAIASQEFSSASKPPHQTYKPFQTFFLRVLRAFVVNQKRTGVWPIPFFLNPSLVFPQDLHRARASRIGRLPIPPSHHRSPATTAHRRCAQQSARLRSAKARPPHPLQHLA